MITHYLLLTGIMLAGLALLIGGAFALRRTAWIARPPCVDLVITVLTMGPWIYGWIRGVQIHGHWSGGLAGLLVACACQFAALEFFDFVHVRYAARRKIANLEIKLDVGRRFGHWRNRLGLWATVPSVPFFLLNRMGHFTSYIPLKIAVNFPKFDQADYITVSRQKIQNLIGADLIWCLYCDWMTGGWSLTSAVLNEVESLWCPLQFADHKKCEKCSSFFRTDHWAPSNATPQQMREAIARTHAARGHNSPCHQPVLAQSKPAVRPAELVAK